VLTVFDLSFPTPGLDGVMKRSTIDPTGAPYVARSYHSLAFEIFLLTTYDLSIQLVSIVIVTMPSPPDHAEGSIYLIPEPTVQSVRIGLDHPVALPNMLPGTQAQILTIQPESGLNVDAEDVSCQTYSDVVHNLLSSSFHNSRSR